MARAAGIRPDPRLVVHPRESGDLFVSDLTDKVFSIASQRGGQGKGREDMLQALRISNFAVIEEVEVGFGAGLTVLTGETGAGKSIVVDALSLLMGARADAEVVRAGAEEATVEGVFSKSPLLAARLGELGLPDLGAEVSVRRAIGTSGRGKAYVNGSLVTIGVLTRLMQGLVDVAGQHDHVRLFDPGIHRALLDSAAGVGEVRAAFLEAYRKLREVDQRIDALGGDEQKRGERAEFLRFQLEELARVDPRPGEDAALEEERRKLSAVDRLRRAADDADRLLASQEDAAADLLGRALTFLTDAAKVDSTLAPIVQSLQSARVEVDEAARELGRYRGSLDADPNRLAEVEDRLDVLKRLCRKHAATLEGVIARRTEVERELTTLENRAEILAALDQERAAALTQARSQATALTAARARSAERFGRQVKEGLKQLALGKAQFEVRVEAREELTADGADTVEFYFSANPGEPARPLQKVASGGEASRLLLALKATLAETDSCGTYVLDEADAGVSGAVADVVGRLIKDVSVHRQVLCITHLPQVAAHADQHLVIEKEQARGRTWSNVVPLQSPDQRTQEVARMLSGVEVTREAIGAAEALFRSAGRAAPARRVASVSSRSARKERKDGMTRRANAALP